MSTPHDSTKSRKERLLEAVLAQTPYTFFSTSGAVYERVIASGVQCDLNQVRLALWELNRKPNQRVVFERRGQSLVWKQAKSAAVFHPLIAKAEGH